VRSRDSFRLFREFFSALCVFAIISGCGAGTSNKMIDLSSTAPPDGGGGTTPPVNPLTFSISVSGFQTSSVTALHVKGDWTKKCEIDPTVKRTSAAFIDCVLEIEEFDAFFSKLKITLNSPGSMCNFVGHYPYWYYKYLPGKTADEPITTTTNSSGATTLTTPSAHITKLDTSGNPLCAFNYPPNGPDCCMGTYVWTKRVTDAGGAVTSTTTATHSWDGKWGNCGSGAGYNMTGGKFNPKTNIPDEMIDTSATIGKVISYDFTAGIDSGAVSNLHMANYIKPDTVPPAGLVDGPGGLVTIAPNPYYLITCYDAAREENGQIRLQIQEWNVVGEIVKKALGNPDITGVDPLTSQPLNDFYDWDDVVSVLGLQYPLR
jgi:hypothetical protein